MPADDVVLVHGLWMNGLELFLLRRRLRRAGFRVHCFRYSTVRAPVEANAARLFDFASRLDASVLHFVGYSLGGLVTLEMLAEHHDALPPGRVVFLGSPVRGSRAAAHLARRGWGKRLLGCAIEGGLQSDHSGQWQGQREALVIAGSRGLGLGRMLGPLSVPNDGTVGVEETCLPGVHTLVLADTHVTLMFSRHVTDAIARFLRAAGIG